MSIRGGRLPRALLDRVRSIFKRAHDAMNNRRSLLAALDRHASRRAFGPWRDSEAEKHEDGLVEP